MKHRVTVTQAANTSDNVIITRIWRFPTFSVTLYKYPLWYSLKSGSFVVLLPKAEHFMARLTF